MAYLKGEDVNLGIAKETSRGTFATPTKWVPARTPTGFTTVQDMIQIQETRGSGMTSQGMEIGQKRSEGDIEVNVRNGSFSLFLLSLLGSVITTNPETGVYKHQIDIQTGNPQNPSLSLALSQLGFQDYKYVNALVSAMALRVQLGELVNATFSLIGLGETTQADFTPAFETDDHYFRQQDTVVKIAAAVGDLGAASALALKEVNLNVGNNARVNQNIGSVTPIDVLALADEVSGSISKDYTDETFHDIFVAGSYRAMSITMERSDVLIGATLKPKVEILLPKISLSARTPNRPIDDIATEDYDFTAHHDATAGYGIRINVWNNEATVA